MLSLTTKSGNFCALSFSAISGNDLTLEVQWDQIASAEDVRECEEWTPGALEEFTGLYGFMASDLCALSDSVGYIQ